MINNYQVGQPYPYGIESRTECTRFDFSNEGGTLVLHYNRPTFQEIENVKSGKIQLAVKEYDETLFLLSKVGSSPWIDAPYSVYLSRPFEFQEILENQGYTLLIILTDIVSGLIKAMRMIRLTTKFSISLRKSIQKQKEKPFDELLYDKFISFVYSNYPTVNLVKWAEVKMNVSPDAEIELKNCDGNIACVQNKPSYIDGLPEELRAHYTYLNDCGHNIMCVLESHLVKAKEALVNDYLIPVAAKYVLEKGYRFVDGYVVVEAAYDPRFGLMIDEEYDEF